MKGTIVMSRKEIDRLGVMEKLTSKQVKQKEAATMLGLGLRQVKRLVQRYRKDGAQGLCHQGRGKVSNHKADQVVLDQAMETIRAKYWDFSPTLAFEKLVNHHQFPFSVERLRQEMIKERLWQPRRRRKSHIYQLRERRACFGELSQLDGSPHPWLEDRGPRCNLNVDIDDATGRPILEFSAAETTQGYFSLVEKHLRQYGIPLAFYADRHSIFQINTPTNLDYHKPGSKNHGSGLTQFGRAMKELGITLIPANSPQAKGRVEKINQTLQDRLVKELRLRNISTLAEANAFLPEFTHDYCQRFAVPAQSQVDMHRPLPKSLDLTKILCLKEYRTLSKNLTCQYQGLIYQVRVTKLAYTLRHTAVTIRDHYDRGVTLWDYRDRPLAYTTIKLIPKLAEVTSKEINHLVDEIVIQQPYVLKNPWETPLTDLEEQNLFYKPIGTV
jgi:transposase